MAALGAATKTPVKRNKNISTFLKTQKEVFYAVINHEHDVLVETLSNVDSFVERVRQGVIVVDAIAAAVAS